MAVEILRKQYPEILIDGEMQVHYAMNKELCDTHFPFNKLFGGCVVIEVYGAASLFYRLGLSVFFRRLIFRDF